MLAPYARNIRGVAMPMDTGLRRPLPQDRLGDRISIHRIGGSEQVKFDWPTERTCALRSRDARAADDRHIVPFWVKLEFARIVHVLEHIVRPWPAQPRTDHMTNEVPCGAG